VIKKPHVDWFALSPSLALIGVSFALLLVAVLVPRHARKPVAAFLAFAAPRALALALGEPEVRSALGENLDLRIPVTLDKGESIEPACFTLAPDAGAAVPRLSTARVSLERSAQATYLRIRSESYVNEPALTLTVVAACRGQLAEYRRDYSILVDPRTTSRSPAAAVPAGPWPEAASPGIVAGLPAAVATLIARIGDTLESIAHAIFPNNRAAKNSYIAALREASNSGRVDAATRERHGIGGMENPVFPGVFERASTSVGGSIHAARLALEGCVAYHPAGGTHHGRRDRASGFCFFNDPVFALLTLLDAGVERVAYVDLDAHHCDAVQDAFAGDERVRIVSIHEAGRWPHTGALGDSAEGRALNLPVPRGLGDRELVEEDLRHLWVPVLPGVEHDLLDPALAQCK